MIVYKFLVEEVVMRLIGIELSVGWIGVVILIVELELVRVVGMIVCRVFLYNEDLICEKDIWIGDYVVVKKVGDIIFEVVNVIFDKCIGEEEEYCMLIYCLVCESEFVCLEEEVVFCCINLICFV